MTDALSIALQKIAEGGAQARPQNTVHAPLPAPETAATAPVATAPVIALQIPAEPAIAATLTSVAAVSAAPKEDPRPSILQMPQKPTPTARLDMAPEPTPIAEHYREPTAMTPITIQPRPPLQLAESPQMHVSAPAAPATAQQAPADPAAADTSSTNQTARPMAERLRNSLSIVREYRTLLTALVVVMVVGVVLSDIQKTSQTGSKVTANEINIEQLLKEFETADQRASERNANRAAELADLNAQPEFANVPENSYPESIADSELPSNQQTTDNDSAIYPDSAVYPDSTAEENGPKDSAETPQPARAKPVRFSGRIQPAQ